MPSKKKSEIQELSEFIRGHMATKEDIRNLKIELKGDIARLGEQVTSIESEIRGMKRDEGGAELVIERDDCGPLVHGTSSYFVNSRGSKPTRYQGSVSICPLGAHDCSGEAREGNTLNKNIFDPRPSVSRESRSIIERMRGIEVVMIGTNRLGNPKWDL
jgi:hypothetical protein